MEALFGQLHCGASDRDSASLPALRDSLPSLAATNWRLDAKARPHLLPFSRSTRSLAIIVTIVAQSPGRRLLDYQELVWPASDSAQSISGRLVAAAQWACRSLPAVDLGPTRR